MKKAIVSRLFQWDCLSAGKGIKFYGGSSMILSDISLMIEILKVTNLFNIAK
jgi:hypothetical protein